MRVLPLLLLATALAPASVLAAPQAAPDGQAMSKIDVPGTTPVYRMRPAEVDQVKGVYLLDNGVTFQVSSERRKLFAQFGQARPVELVAVAENRFVSADRRVTMALRPVAFGDEIMLTYPSDFNVAGANMVTVRLAAN